MWGCRVVKVLIVERVFVEAEEVNISEVMFNGRRKIVLVDLVKNKVEVY
jgi:hypothetical protein